ncbi:hypothetical protein J2R80_000709 [Bradyrhizobium sp. USDA 4541]|nr:hypothetical protein [Bradyrhizobium sp. USDA 4541]MCP1846886.1 hypothetical protein [Bradyrhizobium sp. USDA 4541]
MSAEAPSPAPLPPPSPPVAKPVVKTNRAQIIVFTLLTLLLSAVTVIGGRLWLRNSELLVFAVGDAKGPEAKFAAKLATVLKNNSSRLRLKIAPNPDNAQGAGAIRSPRRLACHPAYRRKGAAACPRHRDPRA